MNRPRPPQIDLGAVDTAHPKWKGLYSASGILLILTAVLWTVVSRTANILYASGYPGDPAAYLQLVSQHQLLAAVTWILWILSDFLLMVPTVALYLLLRPLSPTLALAGSLFAMFFNVYDICVTELNSLVLVSLAHQYASVTTEALRAPLVAAASYGYYALPIQTVLSFATGTFGYLLWCIAMYRGIVRRGTAVYGMVVMIVAQVPRYRSQSRSLSSALSNSVPRCPAPRSSMTSSRASRYFRLMSSVVGSSV